MTTDMHSFDAKKTENKTTPVSELCKMLEQGGKKAPDHAVAFLRPGSAMPL